jgi:hypothetical protein
MRKVENFITTENVEKHLNSKIEDMTLVYENFNLNKK